MSSALIYFCLVLIILTDKRKKPEHLLPGESANVPQFMVRRPLEGLKPKIVHNNFLPLVQLEQDLHNWIVEGANVWTALILLQSTNVENSSIVE